MRNLSTSLKGKLDSMVLTGADAPSCKVYKVYYDGLSWVEVPIPSVISVNVNKDTDAFTQSAEVVLCNVNPTNPNDFGYYNPHRSDTIHNKPQNSWFQELIPNVRIRIYMGYGEELKPVFYGFIDTIDIDISPTSSTLSLKCRDVSKILIERMVNSFDSAENLKIWSIEYPLATPTTTEYHITYNQGDTPDLADIVKDVCMRAGFIEQDIFVENTGITIGDTAEGYFEYEEVNWDAIINDIKSLTSHEFWIDEYGTANFGRPLTRDLTIENEQLFLIDELLGYLDVKWAVESSIEVRSLLTGILYTKGVDWEYDSSYNALYRLEDSTIPSGHELEVDYTAVDFVFKNGKNIFQLPLTISHDDMYGQILVKGDGVEYLQKVESDFILWDGSTLWEDKVLIVDKEALLEESECQVVAEQMAYTMRQKYISLNFNCMSIPHIQLYDVVQVVVYGSVSEAYLVTGINLSYQDNKMDMTLKCYHFSYASI